MTVENIHGIAKHARERMVERYGFDLTPAQWAQVWGDIQAGRATLLSRQPHGSDVMAVALGCVTLRVAVNRASGVVVSVLAPHHQTTVRVQESRREGRIRPVIIIPGGWKRGERKASRKIRNLEAPGCD